MTKPDARTNAHDPALSARDFGSMDFRDLAGFKRIFKAND
jgi:hypothetical protein